MQSKCIFHCYQQQPAPIKSLSNNKQRRKFSFEALFRIIITVAYFNREVCCLIRSATISDIRAFIILSLIIVAY